MLPIPPLCYLTAPRRDSRIANHVANVKLTNTTVRGLEAGARDIIHWDREVRGFGVKGTPKGRKVFLVQYRPNGHVGNARKFTIGRFQAELADALGLSAVHVNRSLQEHCGDGLFRLRGGSLTILNWDGLKSAGEFDPAYLHLGGELNERAA